MSRSSCRFTREKHYQYHPTDRVYAITHLICSVRVSALSYLPFYMTSVRPIIECDRRTMFKTYDNDVSVSCMVHASPRVTGARVHWRRTKSGFNSTLAHGENERYFSFEQLDEVGAQQWHCVIKPRVWLRHVYIISGWWNELDETCAQHQEDVSAELPQVHLWSGKRAWK